MQDVSRGTGFGGGNQVWNRELFHVEHSAANWEPACSTWNVRGGQFRVFSRCREAPYYQAVRRLFRLSEFLLGGDAAGNGALGWVRASPMCGFSRSRGGREPQSRG